MDSPTPRAHISNNFGATSRPGSPSRRQQEPPAVSPAFGYSFGTGDRSRRSWAHKVQPANYDKMRKVDAWNGGVPDSSVLVTERPTYQVAKADQVRSADVSLDVEQMRSDIELLRCQ